MTAVAKIVASVVGDIRDLLYLLSNQTFCCFTPVKRGAEDYDN